MRRVNPPVKISVRRHGFRLRTISRIKFESGPAIAGWVNYRGKVYPLFQDPGGALYLDEDGRWNATVLDMRNCPSGIAENRNGSLVCR